MSCSQAIWLQVYKTLAITMSWQMNERTTVMNQMHQDSIMDLYDTLHLIIHPALHDLVSKEHARAAQNKSTLRQFVCASQPVALSAAEQHHLARDLVQSEDGTTVDSILSRQQDSKFRCWMKAITGTVIDMEPLAVNRRFQQGHIKERLESLDCRTVSVSP